MKIEKFDNFIMHNYHNIKNLSRIADVIELTWNHQEKKLLDVLDFISLLGQQKELDHFLKQEKGW